MKDEYILTAYLGSKAVTDELSIRGYEQAINEAKATLVRNHPECDEIDIKVIYDADDWDAEISDVWYSITRDGIKKYNGGDLTDHKKFGTAI